MKLWDKHQDFSAKNAAALVSENSGDCDAVFQLMQDAYIHALTEASTKYYDLFRRTSEDQIKARYKSYQEPIPPGGFVSRQLKALMATVFCDRPREAALAYFRYWQETGTNEHDAHSSNFLVQRFTRPEIDRWLRLNHIESRYIFVPRERMQRVQPIDLSTLATPDELLAALEQWGLKKRWFNEPSKHPWLYAAREFKGMGGNKATAPLYCPYKVIIGLLRKSRTGRRRFSEQKGWEILRKNFPSSYERFKGYIPDDDQSKNDS